MPGDVKCKLHNNFSGAVQVNSFSLRITSLNNLQTTFPCHTWIAFTLLTFFLWFASGSASIVPKNFKQKFCHLLYAFVLSCNLSYTFVCSLDHFLLNRHANYKSQDVWESANFHTLSLFKSCCNPRNSCLSDTRSDFKLRTTWHS